MEIEDLAQIAHRCIALSAESSGLVGQSHFLDYEGQQHRLERLWETLAQ